MATPFSLELRDVKTAQTMLVPPEGLVFGREGGDADVTFRDAGISKRHARVFAEGGSWMLEDLGSSNGTWIKGQRITAPVRLNPGDTFHLNKQQLQVTQLVSPTMAGAPTYGDVPAQTGMDEEPAPQEDEPTPKPQPRPAAARSSDSSRGVEPSRSGAARVGSQPPPGKRPPPAMLRPAPEDLPEDALPHGHDEEPPPEEEPIDEGGHGADDVGGAADALKSKGIGYFFVAVPKAIAFYLAAVPVMLFNPVGTIRNGPKKMKFEAMGPLELIPYALVPGLIGAAMGFVGAVIAQLIGMIAYHGSLGIGALLGMLIMGPIIAVVVAVITGFVFHPVLNWIVKFLKGESDAKSRTNYFVQAQTAAVLVQVPSALVPIMTMIHLPLVGLVPLVVSFACTLITLFVSYTWFIHFNVVKWFRYVILAVGGLAALGTLAGIPRAITGGPSVPTVASADDVQAQMDAAMKKAEQLQKLGPAAQQKALAAAQEAAKKGKSAGQAVAAAEENPPGVEEVPIDPPKAKDAPKPAAKADPPKEEAKAEPKEETAKEAPLPPPEPSSGGYAKWNKHREAIEKEFADDPIKLTRIDGLLPMYKQYEQHRYDAEQKWSKATAKKPSEARVNEHLRDAELYKDTDHLVDQMWERLGH